ncbi:protein of unknown function DUF243 [Trinorchestia longiramus]|nr:protein of unknown function DUF243 [Trinorchestia longiramus]
MKFLITAALVAVVTGAPDGRFGSGLNSVGFGREGGGSSSFGGAYQIPTRQCGDGEVLNTDGVCGVPEVNRKIYVFAAKPTFQKPVAAPIPEPEVNIDVILVKTPESITGAKPIVVPPPEQKTVVYVLSKRPQVGQDVIEVPSVPEEPEVYFVNYDDGDNPILPGGIDLQTALAQASQGQGSLVDGGGQFQQQQQPGFGYDSFL